MAVTFTPNVGLAKPTEVEIAEDWVNGSKWQEDNNLIIIDKMDIEIKTWSAAITAATTPPNTGTGTVKAQYWEFQGFIFGDVVVEFFDAGITAGSGEYAINLPITVDGSFHTVGTALNNTPGQYSVIGEGYAYDASTPNTSGCFVVDAVTVSGTSYMRFLTEAFTTPAKTSRNVRDGQPFTVANLDRLIMNFFYKRT